MGDEVYRRGWVGIVVNEYGYGAVRSGGIRSCICYYNKTQTNRFAFTYFTNNISTNTTHVPAYPFFNTLVV